MFMACVIVSARNELLRKDCRQDLERFFIVGYIQTKNIRIWKTLNCDCLNWWKFYDNGVMMMTVTVVTWNRFFYGNCCVIVRNLTSFLPIYHHLLNVDCCCCLCLFSIPDGTLTKPTVHCCIKWFQYGSKPRFPTETVGWLKQLYHNRGMTWMVCVCMSWWCWRLAGDDDRMTVII